MPVYNRRNGFLVNMTREYDHDPPTSYPWHDPAKESRYLEGNKVTKRGRETDSRRSNLYRAESMFAKMMDVPRFRPEFDSLEAVADYVRDLLRRAWWQRRYKRLTIHVKDGRGGYNARASHGGSTIQLPRRSRSRLVLLHELTHTVVTPKRLPHASHGRLFAARFRELVGWEFGDTKREALTLAYRENNVKWHPRRT